MKKHEKGYSKRYSKNELYDPIVRGDVAAVATELQRMPDYYRGIINNGFMKGLQPLVYACKNGDVEMARLLLQFGAAVNHTSWRDISLPLTHALERNDTALIKLLFEYGLAIDSKVLHGSGKGAHGYTSALGYAKERGHVKSEQLLLDHGVKQESYTYPSYRDDRKYKPPMHRALQDGASTEELNALRKRGASIHQCDRHGNNPLLYAIKSKTPLEAIEWLLKYKADTSYSTEHGNALDYAVENKRWDVVDALIKNNAPIHYCAYHDTESGIDLKGSKILLRALQNDAPLPIITALMQQGISPLLSTQQWDSLTKRGYQTQCAISYALREKSTTSHKKLLGYLPTLLAGMPNNLPSSMSENQLADIRKALEEKLNEQDYPTVKLLISHPIYQTLLKEIAAPYVQDCGLPPVSIPNPKSSPARYLDFIKLCQWSMTIAESCAPEDTAYQKSLFQELMHNAEQNWEKVAQTGLASFTFNAAKDVHDIVEEFTRYVVVPEYIRRAQQAKAETIPNVRLLTQALAPSVASVLMKGRDTVRMLELSERWHARRDGLLMAQPEEGKIGLRDIVEKSKWPLLLAEKSIAVADLEKAAKVTVSKPSTLQIVNLNMSEELQEEGQRLRHCVGGYGNKCKNGETHIFSCRNADGQSLATFELEKKNGELKLIQQRSYRDADPTRECQDAIKLFVETVQKRSASLPPVGHDRLNMDDGDWLNSIGYQPTRENINRALSVFKLNELRPLQKDAQGQPIPDPEESVKRDVEAFMQIRQDTFLPKRFMSLNADAFFEKSGLGKVINSALKLQGIEVDESPKSWVLKTQHGGEDVQQREKPYIQAFRQEGQQR